MKQINIESEDPLKRIQEEINEVTQRERELRKQLLIRSSSTIPNGISDQNGHNGHSLKSDFEDSQYTPQSIDILNNNSSNNSSDHSNENLNDQSNEMDNLNGHSGVHYKKQKSVQPRTAFHYSSSPTLMRARSTPQIYTPGFNKKINGTSIQKGFMQKFIESRGKILVTKQPQNNNAVPHANHTNNMPILNDFNVKTAILLEPTTITTSPAQIERDSDGRPIRRGYVPVEEKIQNELRDIKNREVELKKLRREIVQKQSSMSSLSDEEYDYDDDGEYSYDYPPPGKLRASKSIGELCNAVNNSSISSLRDSPSPVLAKPKSDLRPALSLAQLCDIEPEEVPSSHRLIAQWENLIHQKSQKVT